MKKGFTLIELITSLTVLSIIALIVVPNVTSNVREYKKKIYNNNMQSIADAARNWSTENMNQTNFPQDENSSLLLTIEELVNGPHLDKDVKDSINGGYFDDNKHFTFVIIDCTPIRDEITDKIINYDYSYNTYISIDDFIEKKAIEYAKDNSITTTTTISFNTLKGTYIKNTIYQTNWYNDKYSKEILTINNISDIKIEHKNKEYTAVVNWS